MQQFSTTIQERLSEANETLQVLNDMQRAAHAFHNTRLHIAAAIEFQNALQHMQTQRERQRLAVSSTPVPPKVSSTSKQSDVEAAASTEAAGTTPVQSTPAAQ